MQLYLILKIVKIIFNNFVYETALYAAVKRNCTSIVKLLLTNEKIDVNVINI